MPISYMTTLRRGRLGRCRRRSCRCRRRAHPTQRYHLRYPPPKTCVFVEVEIGSSVLCSLSSAVHNRIQRGPHVKPQKVMKSLKSQ